MTIEDGGTRNEPLRINMSDLAEGWNFKRIGVRVFGVFMDLEIGSYSRARICEGRVVRGGMGRWSGNHVWPSRPSTVFALPPP